MPVRPKSAFPFLIVAAALPFGVEAGRGMIERFGERPVPPLAVAAANAAGFAALAWIALRPFRKNTGSASPEVPARLRHILDDLPAAIYLCDRQNTITYCNDSAAEAWGHVPAEHEPAERLASVYRLRNQSGERISYQESCMAVGLAENRTFRGEEIILERPDGSFRTLLAYVSPFEGSEEFAPGTINVLVDVTQIKFMEKILRDANETLELRVRERTRELEAAKEKAERSEQAKLRFLAAISHDLRTPLSGVLLAAQAMLAKGDELPAERRKHLLQHVVECVREQISFINDLLTLVSYENAGQTNFRAGLPLNSILETSRETVALQADAKKIKIHFQKPHHDIPICGDPHQLVHLFSNLLSNAVKFTAPGGHIALAIHAHGPRAQVLIQDNGVGFIPEQIRQFQSATPVAQHPGTQGEPGTGLGLAIVRHIADLHDAEIQLESEPGKGSHFTITFPPAETLSKPVNGN
jgi:PAS domain S-box-containing protein